MCRMQGKPTLKRVNAKLKQCGQGLVLQESSVQGLTMLGRPLLATVIEGNNVQENVAYVQLTTSYRYKETSMMGMRVTNAVATKVGKFYKDTALELLCFGITMKLFDKFA